MSQPLRTAGATATRCEVCGCPEARTDHVLADALAPGWVQLGECPRCDHRWTRRQDPPAAALPARRSVRPASQVASAA